jgi:quinol monooxygenase YgiN
MSGVGRYVKMTAQPGRGQALAELMLGVAAGLDGFPGCDLYVINRSPAEPDVLWITELWRSQAAVDDSLQQLQTDAGRARFAEVSALLARPPERIDLEPVGGVGVP